MEIKMPAGIGYGKAAKGKAAFGKKMNAKKKKGAAKPKTNPFAKAVAAGKGK